ncbi:MAG: dTMP kinase [Psychromonas sp.]|nr:dTMP kinase [Psychromonas sp.]
MSNLLAGKFIVIEGIEGAGKSTAIKYVIKWLEQKRIDQKNIIFTREPGGTVLAEKIRDIIKMEIKGELLQDKSELLLMYAARVQLIENIIKPSLAAGATVIGDRHNYSSFAYQGGGRQIDLALIKDIQRVSIGDFKPDFTLYLDISPEQGLTRAKARGKLDRIERQEIAFFDRSRAVFKNLVENDENAVSIEAERKPKIVELAIYQQLDQWLARLENAI